MSERVQSGTLQVDRVLHDFLENEALPGSGLERDAFWRGFEAIVRDFTPRNRALLERRGQLQGSIDNWLKERRGQPLNPAAYRGFLAEIGYLVPDGPEFTIETVNVDDEIAVVAGPQLVVPVTIARYALNAANARWGSLYDALYGTDAIAEDGGAGRGDGYNAVRGARGHCLGSAFPRRRYAPGRGQPRGCGRILHPIRQADRCACQWGRGRVGRSRTLGRLSGRFGCAVGRAAA